MFSLTRSLARQSLRQATSRRTFSTSATLQAVRKAYTQSHEWVSVDSDTKIATIGVTEYAQKALGDVVYCEVNEPGTVVERSDALGAVESVKSASDIYAPISGEVIEMNAVLQDKPGHLNKGAETDGWLCKIKAEEDWESEMDDLLDEAGYKEHCAGEEDH